MSGQVQIGGINWDLFHVGVILGPHEQRDKWKGFSPFETWPLWAYLGSRYNRHWTS